MSNYNAEMAWADVLSQASNAAGGAESYLYSGLRAYDNWQSFRAGRTNAQIATDLGGTATEAKVAEVDSMYAALKALYDYASNQTPVQSDYLFSIRKFS